MSVAWLHAPAGKAAEIAMGVAVAVPMLTTARLRLRAPMITDYPSYRDVFMSDRAQHMGGPFTQDEAFADFCQGIAGWLLRGAGMWTVTLQSDDAPLGWIYLWQEMGDPEPELGWVLTEAAAGHGYASEAARAVLPHAVALFGADGFVSYIAAENRASARIAVALGAVRDAKAEACMLALGEEDLHVYRHSGKGTPQ
jgi:RimJ/RimL family protein N-acetyltransferase